MNKTELVDAVAKAATLSKVDAAAAINALIETITKTVAAGDAVQLIGFGTFKAQERAAREGRNPSTGEAMNIPAAVLPKFTAGATFKEAVAAAAAAKKGKKAKKK